MGDLLQIGQMAVKESTADSEEVRVPRVLNLDHTPWVLTGADLAVVNLNEIFRADDGERHQATKLSVLLNGILIILLNIIREVVDGDAVVFNILHNQLLRLGQFCGGKGVGLSNDGNDVNTGRQALHQFDVELTETVSSGGNEVQQDVHTVVSEAGVTLNSGFFRKNVIVLALEVTNNLAEAARTS